MILHFNQHILMFFFYLLLLKYLSKIKNKIRENSTCSEFPLYKKSNNKEKNSGLSWKLWVLFRNIGNITAKMLCDLRNAKCDLRKHETKYVLILFVSCFNVDNFFRLFDLFLSSHNFFFFCNAKRKRGSHLFKNKIESLTNLLLKMELSPCF